MIDAKQAFQFARQHAVGMLGDRSFRLEEVERDTYKGREVWRITLGYPQDRGLADIGSAIRTLGFGDLEYKVFLIDETDGDLVAMKLREPSPQ